MGQPSSTSRTLTEATIRTVVACSLLWTVFSPARPAVSQGEEDGGNPILQAAVRIEKLLMVVPDDPASDPFECEYGTLQVATATIFDSRGFAITNHSLVSADVSLGWEAHCLDQIEGDGGGTVEVALQALIPNDASMNTDVYQVEVIADSGSMADDLAIVRLGEPLTDMAPSLTEFPTVDLGDSSMLADGAELSVYGYVGFDQELRSGEFTGTQRSDMQSQPRITTSARIDDLHGGAVLADGLLVGIVTTNVGPDCLPIDTNTDGVQDDFDSCLNIETGRGILIPSSEAHRFAEEALGETIPVRALPEADTPESRPPLGHSLPGSESNSSDDQDQSDDVIGPITLNAHDANGAVLSSARGARYLRGCFDNHGLLPAYELSISWLGPDTGIATTVEWDSRWNDRACVTWTADPKQPDVTFAPGEYQLFIVLIRIICHHVLSSPDRLARSLGPCRLVTDPSQR